MNKIYKSTLSLVAILVTSFAFAQYDTGDTTALGVIRDNNFGGSSALDWTGTDPGTWVGVTWDNSTPKRVIELELTESGASSGPQERNDWRVDTFPYNKYLSTRTGVATNLTGIIDVSALSMLEVLMVRRNSSVTNLNMTGLANLKYVFASRTAVTSLDFSGMTNLIEVHTNNCPSLQNIDFSGCTNLKRVSSKNTGNLTSVSLSGASNLVHLCLPNSGLSSLDLTGLTSLWRLKIKDVGFVSDSIINLDDCTNLRSISAESNNLTSLNLAPGVDLFRIGFQFNQFTSMDFTPYPNLYKVGFGDNPMTGHVDLSNKIFLESVRFKNTNISSIDLSGDTTLSRIKGSGTELSTIDFSDLKNLDRVGMKNNGMLKEIIGGLDFTEYIKVRLQNNALPITLAAQWGNLVAAPSIDVSGQFSYDQETILVPDSIDFSAEDSVEINAAMVSTSFELFALGGASQGTNTTGIFNMAMADTGCYYVELTNSGVTVTSDTICVVDAGAIINTSIASANFGTVTIGDSAVQTLTVSNAGNIDLNVSNITLPAGYSTTGVSATVAGGASTTFDVTFKPTIAQTYAGTVSVASDALANAGNNTVNVTGKGDTIAVIGISEETKQLVRFYPNPTSDVLFIEDKTGNMNVLSVYSIQGTLVKTLRMTSNTTSVSVRDLEKGIYFIRSIDGKVNQKIMKN